MSEEARPTSAELRERIVAEWVAPRARAFFERESRAGSVVFLVAQYWADEADDAVHGELLASVDRDPVWPDCASYAQNPLGEPPEDEGFRDDAAPPEDAFFAQQRIWWELETDARGLPAPRYLDENGDMIVAFASYCEEGASQEDAFTTAYTPYCIVRRDEGEVEIVGTMRRPEWEDRWDVVDAGGSMAAAMGEGPDEAYEPGGFTYRDAARARKRLPVSRSRRTRLVVLAGLLLAVALVLIGHGC